MAKIVTLATVMVGISMLLFFAGIIDTSDSTFLAALGFDNLSNIASSAVYVGLAAIFALSLGGIIVGFITNRSLESYIVATFSTFLLELGALNLISIWSTMNNYCGPASDCSWVGNLIKFFTVIMLVIYLISMISWWRGGDN